METFLDYVQLHIVARLKHARNTEEEKRKLYDTIAGRLNTLNTDVQKVIQQHLTCIIQTWGSIIVYLTTKLLVYMSCHCLNRALSPLLRENIYQNKSQNILVQLIILALPFIVFFILSLMTRKLNTNYLF